MFNHVLRTTYAENKFYDEESSGTVANIVFTEEVFSYSDYNYKAR